MEFSTDDDPVVVVQRLLELRLYDEARAFSQAHGTSEDSASIAEVWAKVNDLQGECAHAHSAARVLPPSRGTNARCVGTIWRCLHFAAAAMAAVAAAEIGRFCPLSGHGGSRCPMSFSPSQRPSAFVLSALYVCSVVVSVLCQLVMAPLSLALSFLLLSLLP